MARRRKIAIIYEYNENWIGGTYYIQNLISALNLVADSQKATLVILTKEKKDFQELQKITGYPYLSYRPIVRKLNLIGRGLNKVSKRLLKINLQHPKYSDIDFVFPVRHEGHLASFQKIQTLLFWIPDLQEHFLPEFFTPGEIASRKAYQQLIIQKAKYIVFSSETAKTDFNKIYSENGINQYLLPFAVSHPSLQEEQNTEIFRKFGIEGSYFICSNQFWKHKNHSIILKAIHSLKLKGISITVLFTGKEYDYRNPNYYEELTQMSIDYGITNSIKFLGFIRRDEQLILMKNSLAVIQPSLFEGWSTVVEDGKSMNIPIIASSIDVHKEQLVNYSMKYYFDPLDFENLAQCIIERTKSATAKDKRIEYDYAKDILRFAQKFLNIATDIS